MRNCIKYNGGLFKFQIYPSEADGKHTIIIAGAGIVGCCTAYYLVNHPKYDPEKYRIVLIESKRVAGGASGKAGGLLALWAFPQQIVPLSFNLHQELSDKYNGEKEWGYRRLTTVSLEGDLSHLSEDEDDDEDDDEDEAKETVLASDKQRYKESDSDSSSSVEKPPKSSLEEVTTVVYKINYQEP